MRQLIFIHGGEAFNSYEEYLKWLNSYEIDDPAQSPPKKWRNSLFESLENMGWQIIAPTMPCYKNAKYEHWVIWFEKYLPYIKEDSVFVGHSLGGSFLSQYFQKKELGKFSGLHLVAPAYNINAGGFTHKDDFSKLEKQFDKVFIYHSEDDTVVPFSDSGKLHSLINGSKFIKFKNRNHFFDERSPELEKYLDL
jgi:predicted alpha/beta hydrolase family esterase